MLKKIILFASLACVFLVLPDNTKYSKIVDETIKTETLSKDKTKQQEKASEDTLVLIKLKETSFDTFDNFSLSMDFKKYQKEHYVTNNNNKLFNMDIRYDDLYVSPYSPYIELTFKKHSKEKLERTLEKLETYDFVEEAFVQEVYKPEKMSYIGKQPAGALGVIESYGLTGQNVPVGILDAGIVDVNNVNISSSSIVCRDEWYFIETVDEHATQMASVIGGQDGYASACSFYSVQLAGNLISEVDWLVSQEIDVCNISVGNGTGSYSSDAGYLDYISYKYGIIFCCAVGNDGYGDAKVSNFALSKNCIPVGSSDLNFVSGYTSYETPDDSIRPLISAPGTLYLSQGFESGSCEGTSYATAVVTGIVALLLDYRPSLMGDYTLVKALLMANTEDLRGTSYDYQGLDRYGAGIINLKNTLENIDNYRMSMNNKDLDAPEFYGTCTRPTYIGDSFRAALCYRTYTSGATTTWVRTDYSLATYDLINRYTYAETNIVSDGVEFSKGTVITNAPITFTFKQIGPKKTAGTEVLYIAFKIIPASS